MSVTVPPYPSRRVSWLVAVRVSNGAGLMMVVSFFCCASGVETNKAEVESVKTAIRKPTLKDL